MCRCLAGASFHRGSTSRRIEPPKSLDHGGAGWDQRGVFRMYEVGVAATAHPPTKGTPRLQPETMAELLRDVHGDGLASAHLQQMGECRNGVRVSKRDCCGDKLRKLGMGPHGFDFAGDVRPIFNDGSFHVFPGPRRNRPALRQALAGRLPANGYLPMRMVVARCFSIFSLNNTLAGSLPRLPALRGRMSCGFTVNRAFITGADALICVTPTPEFVPA